MSKELIEREAFEAAFPGYKAMVEDAPASRAAGKRIEQPSNMFRVWLYCRAQQPQSAEAVAYTTAGMLAIAKELPLTGRIGARCKADDRWNVPLYTTPQPSAGVVMPDWKGFSERLMDFITHAEVSSGVCCCGDYMQGHADPMASGHSPVDMWDNAVVEFGREFARLNGKEVGK